WARELGWMAKGSPRRHHFVLSKGHACPALYAVAAEAGLIAREQLLRLRRLGSPLQGHPHLLCAPWVETSTGSLAQGFSVSIGLALALRFKKISERVYVLLGDGEMQEGEVWEGAMCAGHYRLDGLCAVIDYNKQQSDDLNENVMGLEPLGEKWKAFRWHTIEIDGHRFEEMDRAFAEARGKKGRPTVIIAHTKKGKGVSFMEDSPLWHGSVRLRDHELERALRDLGQQDDEIRRCLDGTIF
ncbi:MAG: transketolase, partial [Acidobacteriota bacterium]